MSLSHCILYQHTAKLVKDMHIYHNQHAVLHKGYMWFGKNEFRLLKSSSTGEGVAPYKHAHGIPAGFLQV